MESLHLSPYTFHGYKVEIFLTCWWLITVQLNSKVGLSLCTSLYTVYTKDFNHAIIAMRRHVFKLYIV